MRVTCAFVRMVQRPMRTRALLAACALVSMIGGTASAVTLAGINLAPALDTEAGLLELASCGVRDTLWIEHYVAGLYVPSGDSVHAASDPARAKAVRLHVVDERYLPKRLPEKWREALLRELDPTSMSRIRTAYRALGDRDVLTILYVPQQGVTMWSNGELVVHAPGHRVIDSILKTWGENEPVADKLDRLTREHRCDGGV